MPKRPLRDTKAAFTLIDLLVVVAIVVILFAILLPALTDRSPKPTGLVCMSNLRQIGLGFIMYSDDHSNHFPWQISTDADEKNEPIQSTVAADYFSSITNYIPQPRLFVCPTDKARHVATNFANFNNTNLSYFVSLSATMTVTSSPAHFILAGDRHLSFSSQPVKPGLFSITNNAAMGWTKELHFTNNSQPKGVLLFADEHCEIAKTANLPQVLQRQSIATTRLVIP